MYDLLLSDLAELPRDEAEAAIRARTQTVVLGDGCALARVLGRYKMLLDAGDRSMTPHLMLDGFWESWLTIFLAKTIKSGSTLVDVGARYGYFTCLMAEASGPGGRVIAIEADERKAGMLRQTLDLNGFGDRVEVVQATVVGQSVGPVTPGEAPGGAPSQRTLDEICAGLARLDLVFLDFDGGEEEAVAGLANVIDRHRPGLVLRFDPRRFRDPAALLAILTRGDRKTSVIQFDGNVAPTDPQALLNRSFPQNVPLYIHG